ncbi:hypothetical protein IGI04_026810, partial [Brassica rapa subsp. trilocularis]
FASVVIQLTKKDDSVYPGTDHPFRKSIVTDVPREKSYHLKPRLWGKIAVVNCKYEVISIKIKKEVSMRPAYPSSKKGKDYDNLEAEVKKNRRMISLKETLLLHNQQVESIRIVLSIDWKDVGAKKIESTLHDDLALKTWEI